MNLLLAFEGAESSVRVVDTDCLSEPSSDASGTVARFVCIVLLGEMRVTRLVWRREKALPSMPLYVEVMLCGGV